MDCLHGCPQQRISFGMLKGVLQGPLVPERRFLLGGMAAGFMLAAPFWKPSQGGGGQLRPPGVLHEDEFLKKCVRCGECMKVCLKNALYPSVWLEGLNALYTPLIVPRLGYCEFNCTLCGQVCPTGAIPRLEVEEKQRQVIGKAVFNKDHCLPFARKLDCLVCEEHCPIPNKAIRSREVLVIDQDGQQRVLREPYLVEEICTGCGICENICPVETQAGIKIHPVKDRSPVNPDLWLQGSSAQYPKL
jgi:MauM/NapG family ferredoxin protein